MEDRDHRAANPYTTMEGYGVYDTSGNQVGEVEDTVYDAVSNILKYIVVNSRPVLADRIEVNAEEGRVTVPYDAATINSAPAMEDSSGAFDDTVREHYQGRV